MCTGKGKLNAGFSLLLTRACVYVQEVVIMKDRTTGKSRGFGFVTFQRASDAAHAGNKEHMVDGRRCEVGLSATLVVWRHMPSFAPGFRRLDVIWAC